MSQANEFLDKEITIDSINVGDVSIGAVEIKDGDSDRRLDVLASTAIPAINALPIINPDGTNVGGSGLTDAQLRASAIPVSLSGIQTVQATDLDIRNLSSGQDSVAIIDTNKQSAIPYAQILTASTTITPTSGKKIKLLKSQVLQSPANETYNPVTLNFTSLGDVVTGWAYSDSNEWVGATNEVLNINLGNANPVSVNIRYKQID